MINSNEIRIDKTLEYISTVENHIDDSSVKDIDIEAVIDHIRFLLTCSIGE